MTAVARGRSSGSPSRLQGGDVVAPSSGIVVLGSRRVRRSPAIGLAVGGLVRSSLRRRRRPPSLVIATFLLDTLGAGPEAARRGPPAVALQAPRPADGRALRPGRDRRRGGPGGRRPARRHVGPDAARHRQVTSGGGPLDHRARRRLGRPAPRLERPAQDRRRPAPRGDDRDAGGLGRDRAGRDRGLVAPGPAAAAGGGHRARARIGRGRGRATSSCWRPPTGAATCPSSTRSPAGRRRCSRSSSASSCSASGSASPGRSGSSPCSPGSCGSSGRGGRRPGPVAAPAGARKAAADSAILFALATGVMIATYTAIDRVGTRLIDPFPYAAILWLTCSVVLVALGRARRRRRISCGRAGGGAAGRGRRLADARRRTCASSWR